VKPWKLPESEGEIIGLRSGRDNTLVLSRKPEAMRGIAALNIKNHLFHFCIMKKTLVLPQKTLQAIQSGLLLIAIGLVTPAIANPLVIEITGVGGTANTQLSAADQKTGTLKWHDENSRSSFGPSLAASFDLFEQYRLGFKYSPSSGRQEGQVGRYECFLLCAWVGSDAINGKSGGSVLNYKIDDFLFWVEKEFPYGAYKISPRLGLGLAAGKFDFQLNGTREVTSGAIPAPALGIRIETAFQNGLTVGIDSEFYRSHIAKSETKRADSRFFVEKEVARYTAIKVGYILKSFSFDYSDSTIQSSLKSRRDAVFLSLSIRLF
jgi:hypothetical protein